MGPAPGSRAEDEWEFSGARRGSDGPFRGETRGTRIDSATSRAEPASGSSRSDPTPSGATPDGILDLAGSVWEWTSSASGEGENRIFKGGSWAERIPAYLRSAAFSEDAPDYSSISLGFRCARDG